MPPTVSARGTARALLHQALAEEAATGSVFFVLHALPGAVLLLVRRGETACAVECYALARRYPLIAHSRWFEDVAGAHVDAAAQALPAEAIWAAQARGRARDLTATVEELLAEFKEE
jgi:hypothetical protein